MLLTAGELMLASRALVIYGNEMRDREMAEQSPTIAAALRDEALAAIKLRRRISLREEPVQPLSVFAGDWDPPPAA